MRPTFSNVTDLVMVFGDCLRSLTPHVMQVGIEWKDGKNYDDWDSIAQTLYSSIIDGTIAYAVEGEGFSKLAPYGMVMPAYARQSFLCSAQHGRTFPFLRLATAEPAFSTAIFLELDSADKPTGREIRTPLRECEFFALLRALDMEREIVDIILKEKWS